MVSWAPPKNHRKSSEKPGPQNVIDLAQHLKDLKAECFQVLRNVKKKLGHLKKNSVKYANKAIYSVNICHGMYDQ